MENQKTDRKADFTRAFCIAISGGITAFVLAKIASYTPIFPFAWAGFMSLLIYLATGQQRSWSTVGRMFCSFVAGMAWGQLSNLIGKYLFEANADVSFVLDYGVLIFLLLFVHNSFLKNTPFGFVPAAFLGLVLTKAFFGRPIPFIGTGVIGDMPLWAGLICLVAVFVFGIVFAMMLQHLAAFFMSKLLKPNK